MRDTARVIGEVAAELARREAAGDEDAPPIYLVIFNGGRFRELRRGEDDFSFSMDRDKPPSPDKQWAEILRNGPAWGVHSLVWCDSYNNVNRILDRMAMREFEMRVAFQMSAADSSSLLDNPAATKLRQHRGLFASEDLGTIEKFRPYGVPTDAWLAEVRKALLGGSAIVFMEDRSRQPATKADIDAYTIGGARPHGGRVCLAEYNSGWPAIYSDEARGIRAILGDVAVRLEHVGSTSVPELAAKPIIDIVLEVPDSSDEAAYVTPLESHGYELRIREPNWHEHRMLKGPDADINLHVFSAGCPEVERMIRFRDHLRTNAADRGLYETKKRELAAQSWDYIQNYADAKSGVIAEICGSSRSHGRLSVGERITSPAASDPA